MHRAVIIGNWEFPKSKGTHPTLETVEADVMLVESLLGRLPAGTFKTEVLRNESAKIVHDHIEAAVRKTSGDDLLLVYYSGHGIQRPKDTRNSLSLATYDTQPTESPFAEISFDIINTLLRDVRRGLVVLDCCYSGSAVSALDSRAGIDGSTDPMDQAFRAVSCGAVEPDPELMVAEGDLEARGASGEDRSLYLLTACDSTQIAVGDKSHGNGVFTRAFHDVIQGNLVESRPTTIEQLFTGIEARMGGEDHGQTPGLAYRGRHDPEMIVFDRELTGSDLEARARTSIGALHRERAALETHSPTYLLDPRFHFVDWNAVFGEVVAKPLGLRRGAHVKSLLERLANATEVIAASNVKFPNPEDEEAFRTSEVILGDFPPTHTERMELVTRKYGLIVFNKVARQIVDDDGLSRTWSVQLDIDYVQRSSDLYRDIEAITADEILWSRYAGCYDAIIGDYASYKQLTDKMISGLAGCSRCLDVGAGTGNSTMRLLESHALRRVVAIDNNARMLEVLSRKVEAFGAVERTEVLYGDATLMLHGLRKRVEDDGDPLVPFDGVVMQNLLFALDDPLACLKALHEVMAEGAALMLSTSRRSTNIHQLFENIRRSMEERRASPESLALWQLAYDQNKRLEERVCRLSSDDVLSLVQQSGFRISSLDNHEYDDCVVLIHARRRSE